MEDRIDTFTDILLQETTQTISVDKIADMNMEEILKYGSPPVVKTIGVSISIHCSTVI